MKTFETTIKMKDVKTPSYLPSPKKCSGHCRNHNGEHHCNGGCHCHKGGNRT